LLGFSGKSGGRFSKNDLMPSCASPLAARWPTHCRSSVYGVERVLGTHMLHISRRLTVAATPDDELAANFFASACAAGNKSSGGWIERTSPPFNASFGTEQLRRHHPFLRLLHADQAAAGTSRNRFHRMPRLLKTKPIRAVVDIRRMSIGGHIVMPTPTAAPFIAATIGFRQLKIASAIESLASRLCGLPPSVPHLEGAAAARDVGPGAEGATGAGSRRWHAPRPSH